MAMGWATPVTHVRLIRLTTMRTETVYAELTTTARRLPMRTRPIVMVMGLAMPVTLVRLIR